MSSNTQNTVHIIYNENVPPGLRAISLTDAAPYTKWYAFVRLMLILAIAIPGILPMYLFYGWSDGVQRDIILGIIALASNGLFYILIKLRDSVGYQKILALGVVILDILTVCLLIYTRGGVESSSAILFTIPILISAAIFGRRSSYVAAGVCATAYSLLLGADYWGLIQTGGDLDFNRRFDGAYVIHIITYVSAVLMVIAVIVDFITKLLSEKQQQASENLTALLRAQEIAKLGSWEWNVQHDTMTWSDEMYKIYDLDPAKTKLDGDTYLAPVDAEDAKRLRKIITIAYKKKKPFNIDYRIVLPDGQTKYLHSEGRPEIDKHGRVLKVSGTAQDITERHHLDVVKGEFVSLASHQLRTPASGVKSFLSLLMEGYAGKLTKQQFNFTKKAYDANDRQLDIIDNLLNLASIESGKMTMKRQPVDVNEIIDKTIPAHRGAIKDKQQRLIITKDSQPIYVNADAIYLQMAVDNIISNAHKYTPEKGRITVTTRKTKTLAIIEVADTGIGIAKKDLPLLFQKFNRLNNPASKTIEGSGLGLYLAKTILSLHKGEIKLRSQPDKGTRFIIRVPLSRKKRYNHGQGRTQ